MHVLVTGAGRGIGPAVALIYAKEGASLALCACTESELTETIEAAKALGAVAIGRTAVIRPELAWTCCDYTDTMLQRNESGDRAKATGLLDESLTISSELGMRPLMERVLSRRDILKA